MKLGRFLYSGALGVLVFALVACGNEAATVTPTPTLNAVVVATQAIDTPVIAATATPVVAPTVMAATPTSLATATSTAISAVVESGTPGAKPSATDEPDNCDLSVGEVINWVEEAAEYQPSQAPQYADALNSPCVDNRRLAIWLLGSVHDPAAVKPLQNYAAAHPHGDWLRDEFDLVPLAQAAVAYINAPLDKTKSYTVQNLPLLTKPERLDPDAEASAKKLPAASAITLIDEVKTGQSVPDHGGETDLVFERIHLPNDNTDYFIDISMYVAAYPHYFQKPVLEGTP